jgi:hypothetical protein
LAARRRIARPKAIDFSKLSLTELRIMSAAGHEIRECYRALAKTGDNIVGEVLRDQGVFRASGTITRRTMSTTRLPTPSSIITPIRRAGGPGDRTSQSLRYKRKSVRGQWRGGGRQPLCGEKPLRRREEIAAGAGAACSQRSARAKGAIAL